MTTDYRLYTLLCVSITLEVLNNFQYEKGKKRKQILIGMPNVSNMEHEIGQEMNNEQEEKEFEKNMLQIDVVYFDSQ